VQEVLIRKVLVKHVIKPVSNSLHREPIRISASCEQKIATFRTDGRHVELESFENRFVFDGSPPADTLALA
jgi:hypothetical protein